MAYNKIVFDGKTLIDLTEDTVTSDKLASGTTAHDASGGLITGTMISGTGNTLHVTFAEELAGKEYTITNGDETITGTVPDDCVLDVTVTGSGEYTVECEGITASVEVQNVYDVAVITVYANYIAFYSADDSSLNFCGVDTVPAKGDKLLGKTVTTVYTDVTNTDTSASLIPWNSDITKFKSVIFDSSFAGAKPAQTAYWFYNFTNCTSISGLEYLNTSNVTNMLYMFRSCSGLTSLDVSNFNTSNVTNMSYMFYSCSKLTTIYSDDSKFVTTKVTSGGSMFTSCSKLVGGNGTAYSSSNMTSYTMAHVDTASNPGYFTAK